jgi:hypothetical protein
MEATRADLIERAQRDLQRLSKVAAELRRADPPDHEALAKVRRLRDQIRRTLRRLTRPPRIIIHFHIHADTHSNPLSVAK